MDLLNGSDHPIAVVGAGFSGTMTALHILSRTMSRAVLLCERGERFARGTAYGTEDPGHLLNVRASNMSAFPDRPDDFVRWLERSGQGASSRVRATPAGTFVSRSLYGTYLTDLLGQAVSERDGPSRLILVPDEVVDLVPTDGGFRLILAGGMQHAVAGVVLAAGTPLAAENQPGPYVANPWAGAFTDDLTPDEPVVVIGSGLTMVDVALRLRHAGFRGRIVAISRRGLRPHVHTATAPWPTPALSAGEHSSPARLVRRLRREAAAAADAGISWQSVVDSIRPITTLLWQSFDRAAQERFLRHARPWWDVHRHRMAPPVGKALADLTETGVLEIRAGTIQSIVVAGRRARVAYRPRARQTEQVIEAQRVINATGAIAPDQCGNPLLQRLIDRGLVALDCHRLGLRLSPDFAAVDASGATIPRLWAVGPLGVGAFWECTAVPDLRHQAVRVAERVVGSLSP